MVAALLSLAVGALVAPSGPGRREAMLLGAAAASTSPAAIASSSTARPVLVLGAGGGTGRACVAALLAKGISCLATSRTGELSFEDLAPSSAGLLSVASADVTDEATLSQLSALLALKPASVHSDLPNALTIFELSQCCRSGHCS